MKARLRLDALMDEVFIVNGDRIVSQQVPCLFLGIAQGRLGRGFSAGERSGTPETGQPPLVSGTREGTGDDGESLSTR
jgi:hypothetical protein